MAEIKILFITDGDKCTGFGAYCPVLTGNTGDNGDEDLFCGEFGEAIKKDSRQLPIRCGACIQKFGE